MPDDVYYPPHCLPIVATSSTSELVKRLKAVALALRDTRTGESGNDKDPEKWRPLAEHLSNAKFLNSSSRDIQLWLACSLADIFRLFNPSVPFGDPTQLREVFLFIIRALKGLDDPSSPLFKNYYYLLENLSCLTTLHLISELPSDDAAIIVKQLIKTSLEITHGKEWKKQRNKEKEAEEANEQGAGDGDDGIERTDKTQKVLGLLMDMISNTLKNIDQVTTEILDTLFFFIVNPTKMNHPESYQMAKNLITTCQTSLEAAIQSLLTTSLLGSAGLPDTCELVGTSRAKLNEIILELQEISPILIVPILPSIALNMKSEDDQHRLLATKLIGKLIKSSQSRIYEENPFIWSLYLGRFDDASKDIRDACVAQASDILLHHSQLRGELSVALEKRIRYEIEAEVRTKATYSVIEVARRKLEAVNENLILACCERMRDRKPEIRKETLKKLLQLHGKIAIEEEYTVSDKQALFIIVRKAFNLCLMQNMGEEKKIIERYFQSFIIPYRMEVKKRVKWILNVYCKLIGSEAQVFSDIVRQSALHRRLVRELLKIMEQNKDEQSKRIACDGIVKKITMGHYEQAHFNSALMKFVNCLSTDEKSFACVASIFGNNNHTTASVEKNLKELLIRVGEQFGKTPKEKESFNYIRHYLEQISPLIIDGQVIEELLREVNGVVTDSGMGKQEAKQRLRPALKLIEIYAEYYPYLFVSSGAYERLLKLLECDEHVAVETSLFILHQMASQPQSADLKFKEVDKYENIVESVWNIVDSTHLGFGRACKRAVRTIARLIGKECEERLNEKAETLISRVSMSNNECVNALQALTQINVAFPERNRGRLQHLITGTIVQDFLLIPITDSDDVHTFDPTVSFEKQPIPKYAIMKAHCLKFISRFLFVINADNGSETIIKKSIDLIFAFVETLGDLHEPKDNISPIEKAYLRAVAAVCLLKLSYIQVYGRYIGIDRFLKIANMVQDEADCVRTYFTARLSKGLIRNRLGIEYLSMFSLANLVRSSNVEEEPRMKHYRDQCRSHMIQAIAYRRRLIASGKLSAGNLPYNQPEYAIAYAVYLLAHQPILQSYRDSENMAILQECLYSIMEPFILKKEECDFEFVYHLMQDIKNSVDTLMMTMKSEDPSLQKEFDEQNRKMWALADLGMLMIVYRAKASIRHEERLTIPSKRFFTKNEQNTKIYAPDDLMEDERERNGRIPTEKKKMLNGTTTLVHNKTTSKAGRGRGNTTTSRGGRTGGTGRGRKPAKENAVSDDDEEEEESESEDEVLPQATTKRGQLNSSSSKTEKAEEKKKSTSPKKIIKEEKPTRGRPRRKLSESEKIEIDEDEEDDDDMKPSTSKSQTKEKSSRKTKEIDDDSEEEEEQIKTPSRGRKRNEPSSPTKTPASAVTPKRAKLSNEMNGTPKRSKIAGEDKEKNKEVATSSKGRGGRSVKIEEPVFSPIPRDGQRKASLPNAIRRGPLSSSTPIAPPVTGSKRRSKPVEETVEEEEDDEEEEEPVVKKGRGRPPKNSGSPVKKPTPKSSQLASTSAASSTATTPVRRTSTKSAPPPPAAAAKNKAKEAKVKPKETKKASPANKEPPKRATRSRK